MANVLWLRVGFQSAEHDVHPAVVGGVDDVGRVFLSVPEVQGPALTVVNIDLIADIAQAHPSTPRPNCLMTSVLVSLLRSLPKVSFWNFS